MGALTLSRRVVDQSTVKEERDSAQYLTFVLGTEAYAVAIAGVKEIIEYRPPTTVPLMPDFVRGVMNLRGRVVPVVDLQVRFGRSSSAVTRRTCIVVFEVGADGEHLYLGAVVDAVTAVVEIGKSDIEPPPAFGAKLRTDFIVGMGKHGDRLLVLLDTSKVLSVEELAALAGTDGSDIDRPPASGGGHLAVSA